MRDRRLHDACMSILLGVEASARGIGDDDQE
jgi:hypothetical protein